MKTPKYCPMCGGTLTWPGSCTALKLTDDGLMTCGKCNWVHYDNPIPVGVVLASTYGDESRSIVMVKRGNPPFVGEWALPGGYINKHEIPKVGACREMKEETGLIVRLEKLLCVCNPMPGEVNQIIISYLGRIADGTLKAGDDAQDVQLFRKDNCPVPCFRSHKMLVERWWNGEWNLTGNDLDREPKRPFQTEEYIRGYQKALCDVSKELVRLGEDAEEEQALCDLKKQGPTGELLAEVAKAV